MEHVAGPIHRVSLRFVAAYLVEAGPAPVLVDTGVPGRAPVLLDAARELAGRAVPPISSVIVTHCHIDHAGSLAAVASATGVPVHAHPLDAAVIRAGGPQPRLVSQGWLGSLLLPLFGSLGPRRLEPGPIDVELTDGATAPGGLTALHTPGHTPGHLSFLWPDDGGVLIAGDAAGRSGRLGLSPVNHEPAIALRSFARLAELEFDTACFGHGAVLRGRANAAFRHALDRMASRLPASPTGS